MTAGVLAPAKGEISFPEEHEMKHSFSKRTLCQLAIFGVVLFAPVALSGASTTTTSVTIVNQSNGEIRNVYLSHVNADDWSANQLGDSIIPSGASTTLSNVACDSQQLKVIAEDQDGCFASTVINRDQNSTWTITNNTARDCGN
jgi:hypothetical protein